MLEQVRADGLLTPGKPVLVLLSGGCDSTCLLDLAVRICGPGRVRALHVNYGLRDGAERDERHCGELCERLGVPLEVRRVSRPRPARQPASPDRGGCESSPWTADRAYGNLQAWARDERYGAAAQLAAARGADIAAGHTASDQVETVLYRLASSPSRRALLGMRSREGALIRPLLRFTRGETAEYCTKRGLEWREDESNSSDVFARNRVRAGLVPALRQIHPGAERNVLALLELLRDEAAVLDSVVDEVLAGRDSISLGALRELPDALQRLVVQRLADDAAAGLVPGAGRRAGEIAVLTDQGTVELDVGGGFRAVAEYGQLRFEQVRPGTAIDAPAAVRLPIPGSVEFAGREVRCELGPPGIGPGVLDRAALGSELIVRSWCRGDRMRPLGLDGSKSLQDLLTARRVPRRQRASIAVVESDGEIAWVAGVATSERFKVTPGTRETVRLSAAHDVTNP
jgi:tRNA(Ile)-lysidine synthase